MGSQYSLFEAAHSRCHGFRTQLVWDENFQSVQRAEGEASAPKLWDRFGLKARLQGIDPSRHGLKFSKPGIDQFLNGFKN